MIAWRRQSVFFVAGETRLHGELLLPKGKGPFPGVVLCHGLGTDHRAMRPTAQRLVREGIATLAIDFHGHGLSEGVFEGEGARDVNAALDYMSSHSMVDPAHVALVGHSMGSTAAIQAATGREDICALVSLSSPSDMVEHYDNVDQIVSRLLHSAERRKDGIIELPRAGPMPGMSGLQGVISVLWMWVRGYRLRIHMVNAFTRMMRLKPSRSLERMGAFPKLFVHCEGDKLAPYQGALSLFEKARPPKDILLLKGGTHASPLMPGRLRKRWIGWLVSVLKRESATGEVKPVSGDSLCGGR